MHFYYRSSVEPRSRAITAALEGDIHQFEAIFTADSMACADIASFHVTDERHMHDTFFLLFEVAKRGQYDMLRHLIQECGFSVYVLESFLAGVQAQLAREDAEEAALKERGEQIMIMREDAYRYMLRANPYRNAGSLCEYLQQETDSLEAKLAELAQKKRACTRGRKACEAVIAGRNIDTAKLSLYAERQQKHLLDLMHKSWFVPKQDQPKAPRRIPLYDAEIRRQELVRYRTQLDGESEQIKTALVGLLQCHAYVFAFGPQQVAA